MSLKDIIDSHNLTTKHIVLKMGLEGVEWQALRTLPISYLDYIDQITMEIHNPHTSVKQEAYWGNVHIIYMLG